MEILSWSIAFLFSAGVWLMLSREWLRIIIGFNILGHGANLFILKSGGLGDYVPQALILTSIVIGLGTMTVLLSLAILGLKTTGIRDVDFLQEESE